MADQSNINIDYIYSTLNRLIELKYDIRGFSYLPNQPIQSKLTGKHRSRLRGRGLDFEEVRNYYFGDDIRNIDWKVTARMRKAHIKVFTEERERPVFLVVDQSASMFFGSEKYLKSVIASETAALSAWKVLAVGDRVGGLVFNDSGFDEIKPKRSRKNVLQFLNLLVKHNNELKIQSLENQDPEMLNKILAQTLKYVTHDYLTVIISDFYGYDDETIKLLTQLSRHNDVLAINISDQMELNLNANMIIGQADSQINLSETNSEIKKKYTKYAVDRKKYLNENLNRYGITVLDLNTTEPVIDQIRNLIGRNR